MKYETHKLQCKGSLEYACVHTYILDSSPEINWKKRPMVLICPGGGYSYTSDREAEVMATQFMAMGYHAAVLRYSVAPAVFPTALLEVASCVKLFRENAEEWGVDGEHIYVAGFSAGGHLAASYGCFWNRDFVAEELQIDKELLRPYGLILGYPVITSGEYAHHESIQCLLGDAYEEKKEEMSLENYVTEQFPRTFAWHTFEDGLVPCQNSLLLVRSLADKQIPVEYHLFQKGGHGMALASKLTEIGDYGIEPSCQPWISLVHTWMELQA